MKFDERYQRPTESNGLVGDRSKAKKVLGREPQTRTPKLARLVADADVADVANRCCDDGAAALLASLWGSR